MHNHSKPEFFGKKGAKSYDDNSNRMAPFHASLHYLIKAVLNDLPKQAKVLCVGAGTGTEIIELAEAYPDFTFVAVDPSAPMLEVCRDRLKELDLHNRCELVYGYVHDLPKAEHFDAAICLLVTHHTPKDSDERQRIFAGIANRLKPKGYLVNAEISFDYSDEQTQDLVEKWKSVFRLMGAPEGKIQSLPRIFKEHLSILSPVRSEELLVASGFEKPIQFFQALLIRAWYARKEN